MPAETLRSVDALIHEHHLLKHPFYVAWQEGTLTPEALRTYAEQYYQHVRAFPTYISALHSRCTDLATRQTLLRNLNDEEQGPDNHPQLWRRFAAAAGCDIERIDDVELLPETASAIDDFRRAMSEGSVARGLAALYAYESMVPEVATEKIRGLAAHYGIEGSPGTDYFEVHRTLDIEHAEETRALVESRARSAEEEAEAETGAAIALKAINRLLDGVCRAHDIPRAA
jgi:pyrroloquinoline-quinone synthase